MQMPGEGCQNSKSAFEDKTSRGFDIFSLTSCKFHHLPDARALPETLGSRVDLHRTFAGDGVVVWAFGSTPGNTRYDLSRFLHLPESSLLLPGYFFLCAAVAVAVCLRPGSKP